MDDGFLVKCVPLFSDLLRACDFFRVSYVRKKLGTSQFILIVRLFQYSNLYFEYIN